MKPGTYTVTLFQGELEAGTGTVNINAGQTSSITLTSILSKPSTIWSIGTSNKDRYLSVAFLCPFRADRNCRWNPSRASYSCRF